MDALKVWRSGEVIAPGQTPEQYLKITERCLKRVTNKWSSSSHRGSSSSPKFHQEQCRYLELKLKQAVEAAKVVMKQIRITFLSLAEHEEKEQLLAIFKFLCAMGLEAEDCIQRCCEKTWVRSAVLLTNMSGHVVSIASNLEFCRTVFSAERLQSLAHFDVANIYTAESETVKAKAGVDKGQLILDLHDVVESNASGNPDATTQLARFLLERMRPGARVQGSQESTLSPRIPSSVVTEKKVLGKGSYGEVSKGMWLGVEVAKKTFEGPNNKDFVQEVSILEGLSHPNIVSFLWSTTDASSCHLVMELMDKDLQKLIDERMEDVGTEGRPFSLSEAVHLMLQIGEGLHFLHEKKIVHRDLKPENILARVAKGVEGNMQYFHVKVGDFGLSKTKERSVTYSDLTMNVGTTRWMAPELMKNGSVIRAGSLKYPFKPDIYSFGLVCYEILTGNVPFQGMSLTDIRKAVLSDVRPKVPSDCPYRLTRMIETCWNSQPSIRPRSIQICEELRDLKYGSLRTYWKAAMSSCSSKDIQMMDELVGKLSSPDAEVQETAADGIKLQATNNSNHRKYMKKGSEATQLLVVMRYSSNRRTRSYADSALQSLLLENGGDLGNNDRRRSKRDYLGRAIKPIAEVFTVGGAKAQRRAATALVGMHSDVEMQDLVRNSKAMPKLDMLLKHLNKQAKGKAAEKVWRLCARCFGCTGWPHKEQA